MNPQAKVKKPTMVKDNFVEQGSELLKSTAGAAVALPQDIFREALVQVRGSERKPLLHGEINLKDRTHTTNASASERQPSNEQANSARKEQAVGRQFQAAKKEFQAVNEGAVREKQQQVEKLHAQLAAEIKKLQSRTAELSADVSKMTVESHKTSPDKYHENLLLWLIKEVQNLGRKVTESRMWLQVAFQKKQKRGFWQMAKTHGNTFTMSSERVPAGGVG